MLTGCVDRGVDRGLLGCIDRMCHLWIIIERQGFLRHQREVGWEVTLGDEELGVTKEE